MPIHSTPFSGPILTGEDAVKFARQVKYGRPKPSAAENVSRGIEMVREFKANGRELVFGP